MFHFSIDSTDVCYCCRQKPVKNSVRSLLSLSYFLHPFWWTSLSAYAVYAVAVVLHRFYNICSIIYKSSNNSMSIFMKSPLYVSRVCENSSKATTTKTETEKFKIRWKTSKLWKVRDKTAENGISFAQCARTSSTRIGNNCLFAPKHIAANGGIPNACAHRLDLTLFHSVSHALSFIFADIVVAAVHLLIFDLFLRTDSCAECNIRGGWGELRSFFSEIWECSKKLIFSKNEYSFGQGMS